MYFKVFVFICPLALLTTVLSAKPVSDSVGVENQNGKKVILHKVDPKETYFAIGRRYNIKPNLIIQFNNNIVLQPGMTVKVPTELPFAQATATKPVQQPALQQPQGSTQQYKVAAHETLYAISKRFGVTVDAIKQQNNLTSDALTPGQVLNITTGGAAPAKPVQTELNKPAEQPVQRPVQQQVQNTPPQQVQQPVQAPVQQTPQQQTPVDTKNTQQYKVSNGETLYTIAKRFGTSVDDITALNKLTSTSLTPGQVLLVRSGMPPAPKPQPQDQIIARRDSTVVAPADTAGHHVAGNRYGLYEKSEKGAATWMDDASLDPNKKLILHRTAPIGTVMRITNPMTNRTTFAKVVGSFTDNESNKDVLVVVTKNVAEALGVLDKRFRVNITYGVPSNEQ